MSSLKNLLVSIFLITFSITLAQATRFFIINNCPSTVWAAVVPGGGRQLDRGQIWTINVNANTNGSTIWARTNCQFDASGTGRCEIGDCAGVLQCTAHGSSPHTRAEFAYSQSINTDFIDMSNINGFNVPMEFSSISVARTRAIRCTANITGECPNELKVPGGCNGPCTVVNNDEYCNGPTSYLKFFKDRCPDVYIYRRDAATKTFTCPGGTNYKVIFCP